MKMKKVGAILAGAALLGATFAAAVSAADMDVPDRDFFIDTTNGLNNCLIVVGSGAAAADVVSAAYVAAQIGSMAYYENVQENWAMPGVVYDDETDPVPNYIANGWTDGNFQDFTDVFTWADSWSVLPYACDDISNPLTEWGVPDPSAPWWDYDVYIDAATSMADDNFLVSTDCSFEAITVDFSLRDMECTADLCVGCMAACDQNLPLIQREGQPQGLSDFDLLECQSYPNVYPRHYWGTPEVYADNQAPDDVVEFCDPTGGIQYRTIVHDIYDIHLDSVWWTAIVGPDSEAYMVCDPHAPQSVELYCTTCDVYFLGKHYDAISFETDANGYDYMFYGTPQWYVEEKLAAGESKSYGDWTLTVNDLNIYENKIHSTITTPEGDSYTYISVINTYTSNVPSNGDGDTAWYEAGANEENDTIAFIADTFDVYNLCGEPDGEIELVSTCGETHESLYSGEVLFAVKYIKSFIGAAGNYVVEYHAYNLEDYGVLKEQIYPGPCDTPIEPAIKVGDLEWYFDIFPADEVDSLDLDNDVALYAEGNPNYDVADKVRIYDATGQNAGFPICVPILELWLATPVELAGLCDDEMTIALNDCDGANYFTMVVTDLDHTDYIIDGTIDFYRKVALEPTVTKVYKEIDPESLVKLDETINAAMKNTYNIVLIGGPVANALVQELVDLGKTTFEQWENATSGDLELIEDAYAVGKDVLIVAGSDRDATAAAALALIAEL